MPVKSLETKRWVWPILWWYLGQRYNEYNYFSIDNTVNTV